MNFSLPLIIACLILISFLIFFPLVVSFKSEKRAKSEWEKIKDYGNKINEKTRRKTENKDGAIFSFFFISSIYRYK